MVRLISVILAFALAASTTGPASGEVVNHPHYTVALDGELEMLLWVSEEVLNATEPPEGFPIGWWPTVERARAALQRKLTTPSECVPQPDEEPTRQQSLGEARTSPADYDEFLASSAAVVVADVRQVESGADVFAEVEIAPRVRVAVSEVLRDVEHSLSPGDELTYLGKGGHLRVAGQSLCALEAPERAVPEAGARVILTASPPSGQDAFVNTSTVFALRGETVELPAGTRFEERKVPLEELRFAVSVGDEGHGR